MAIPPSSEIEYHLIQIKKLLSEYGFKEYDEEIRLYDEMMTRETHRSEHKAPKAEFLMTASVDELVSFRKILKAARRGNAAAQYEVSECYKTGKMGVQINNTEAEKWYSRAVRREKALARQETTQEDKNIG